MTDTPTKIVGRIYCPHMALDVKTNGWHWHRGEKVECSGGRLFVVDEAMIERAATVMQQAGFVYLPGLVKEMLRAALEVTDE